MSSKGNNKDDETEVDCACYVESHNKKACPPIRNVTHPLVSGLRSIAFNGVTACRYHLRPVAIFWHGHWDYQGALALAWGVGIGMGRWHGALSLAFGMALAWGFVIGLGIWHF